MILTIQCVSVSATTAVEIFNCRLHDEAHYAVITIEMNADIETAIDMCDSAMPHDVRKAHFESNSQSGVALHETISTRKAPLTHNPRDCIVLDPFE